MESSKTSEVLTTEEIVRFAHDKQYDDVLETYGTRYIQTFAECTRHVLSIHSMFEQMRKGVQADREIHEIEKLMDRNHFKDTLSKGAIMVSGTEAGTGKPIIWVNCAVISQDCYSFKPGSPKFYAFIRLHVWIFDVAYAAATLNGQLEFIVLFNNSSNPPLNFNSVASARAVSLVKLRYPLLDIGHTANVRFVGLPKLIPFLINLVQKTTVCGHEAPMTFVEHDSGLDIVSDVSDIPEHWFDDESGKRFNRDEMEESWLYRSLITGGRRLTTKEILNQEYHLTQ